MYSLLEYSVIYYMVASMSLIMRCFFQLFVSKIPLSKTDFVLCILWPVMIWLIPLNFIKDIKDLINIKTLQ